MTTKTDTKTAENPLLVPGAQFHFCGTRSMTCHTSETGLGGGVLLQRGSVVSLTDTFIRLNAHWLWMLGNEQAQQDHWNEVRIKPGPWPEGLLTTVPGHRDHEIAREAARQAAWAEPDSATRALALREVERVYGRAPSTSTTIGHYEGGR